VDDSQDGGHMVAQEFSDDSDDGGGHNGAC
jgi:hypothetical protein